MVASAGRTRTLSARGDRSPPAGRLARIVLPKALSAPLVPITNPEIVDDPAFDVYTKRPFGVTANQQVAAPRVGRLELRAESLISGRTA